MMNLISSVPVLYACLGLPCVLLLVTRATEQSPRVLPWRQVESAQAMGVGLRPRPVQLHRQRV